MQRILADKAREEAAQAIKSPIAGALKDNDNVADQANEDVNPESATPAGTGSAVKEEEPVDEDI